VAREDADIEAKIEYEATDSIVFDLAGRRLQLFNTAQVKYTDMQMNAGHILVVWDSSLVYANGFRADTADTLLQTPVFKEDQDVYYAEGMVYNFKTRYGRIRNARTNQDNQILLAETTKRNPDNTFYVQNGRFTSCDADHPHYYIQARRIKVIPGKQIITGRAQFYVADVPTPLILPFGMFPSQQKRASGIILPEYGRTEALGYFFRNMGYYWAVNDYFDLKFLGDLYTKGSFGFSVGSNYAKQYRFTGNALLQFASLGNGYERRDPAYTSSRNFTVTWRHQQTLTPTSRLQANVNYTSPFLNRLNSNNAQMLVRNTVQSSVGYSTSLPNSPWSLTASANMNQDLRTRVTSLTLPDLGLTRARTFPFRSRTVARPWRDKIGVSYSAQATNRVTTYDSLLFSRQMLDTMDYGLRQNIDVSTQYNLLQYITIQPAFRYNEYTYLYANDEGFEYIDNWVPSVDSLTGDTTWTNMPQERRYRRRLPGLNTGRDFSLSLTATTSIYSLWQPRWSRRQFALRWTARPSVGYNYTPDFGADVWGYYRTVRSENGTPYTYSRFSGLPLAGIPAPGERQAITFGVGNVVESKWLRRDANGEIASTDSAGKPNFRYLTLFDEISLNSSYNFAADSQQLADFAFSARSTLLQGKVTMQLGSSLDPYEQVNRGTAERPQWGRGNRLMWDANRRLGNVRTTRFNVNFNLRGKERPLPTWETLPEPERALRQLYQPMRIPWNLSVGYAMNYDNAASRAPGNRENQWRHDLNLNGSLTFGGKWQLRASTYFNLVTRELGGTNLGISRDLHCWRFQFDYNLAPSTGFRSYYMTIVANNPTLRDLKIEKRRNAVDGFIAR
jgi:hypothetical protein